MAPFRGVLHDRSAPTAKAEFMQVADPGSIFNNPGSHVDVYLSCDCMYTLFILEKAGFNDSISARSRIEAAQLQQFPIRAFSQEGVACDISPLPLEADTMFRKLLEDSSYSSQTVVRIHTDHKQYRTALEALMTAARLERQEFAVLRHDHQRAYVRRLLPQGNGRECPHF